MLPHRSTLLLILLVVMPLALLAWLGTYLHHDGERRAKATRDAILLERLQVADHQLHADLRLAVQQLDRMTEAAAEASAKCTPLEHEWTRASLCLAPDGEALVAGEAEGSAQLVEVMTALRGHLARSSERGGQEEGSFELVSGSLAGAWRAYRMVQAMPTVKRLLAPVQRDSGLLIQDAKVGLPQFVHWHQLRDGRLLGNLLDSAAFSAALFSSLPPAGMKPPPGQMTLSTESGVALHHWGQMARRTSPAEVEMGCATPLQRWKLGYLPAPDEFPSAMLFPILLGITSGSLLVPALAWLYFRESSREIRVAHQRVSFVNQVSHELKTPLTNIRLYAEMARSRAEDREDAASVRQLQVVESETARLSRLIQNVLNFARKQRDRLTVLVKPVNLAEVVSRLASHWRPILDKRGITLELEAPEHAAVETDADAVEQVVGNLLSNAEKYAAEGKWVRLSLQPTEEGAWRIVVEDRGPGIPSGKQEQVFEPFERLRSDLREGVSGTGIGLTISRELAQLLGGTLHVDTDCRTGARFVFTLSATAAPPFNPNQNPQPNTP